MYLAGEESNAITTMDDLRSYFSDACTAEEDWRVGTEHEMIGVLANGEPVPYRGHNGLSNILDALVAAGWSPIKEAENIIALTCEDSQVSIEPGGQLEHAARPHHSSTHLDLDLRKFLDSIRNSSRESGISWITGGFRPWGSLDDVGWVPKHRYNIMREYLPSRGGLAHEMMKRTATVQVNLDYASEADAHAKMRAIMSVTSLLTAIFANSPIVDGAVSGYQSYRGHVWTDMDPDRCGLLDFVFRDGDFFTNWAEWALDVPMFFVHRDSSYVPANGMTFRQFMDTGFEGHEPTMDDWGLHLSTLFPDGRMKQFLEVRGCDASTIEMTVALGALCCGFMYDDTACQAAIDLTASLKFDERLALADLVNKQGLSASVPGGGSVADLAAELVAISADGLSRRDKTELPYLDPIREVVESKRTHATQLLELWESHRGDPAKLIPLLAY